MGTERADAASPRRRRQQQGVAYPISWVPLVPAAIVVFASALRFATLGEQSYWVDEIYTASMLDGGLRATASGVKNTESAPPFYYGLAWLWTRLAGTGEFGLRALSAVAGTGLVLAVYLAGRDLVSRRVGTVAALLAAVSPTLIWYSQEARVYSLFTLLAALSFLFFIRALRHQSPRALAAWTVASALAVHTHYFASFVVIPEFVVLLVASGWTRPVRLAGAALAASALVVAPLAYHQATRGGTAWIGELPFDTRVGVAVVRVLTPAPAPGWAGATGVTDPLPGYWFAGLALLGAASVMLLASAREGKSARGGSLALAIGGAAFAAPLFVSAVSRLVAGGRLDLFLDRNLLAAWMPLNIALVAGLLLRGRAVVGALAIVALTAASVVIALRTFSDPSLQRDDWRGLVQSTDLSAGAVAVWPFYERVALEYYARELEPMEGPVAVRQVIVIVRGQSQRSVQVSVPRGLTLTRRVAFQNFELRFFDSSGSVKLRRGDVATARGDPLYLATARAG